MIEYFNSISKKTDYYPKRNITNALNDFLSHKLGMFISYGLTTFTNSDSYATNYLVDPPTPSTFNAPSIVDSAQWVTEAKNSGCDYAVLTTGHHIGFNLFPYTAPLEYSQTYDTNRGLLNVPVYERYDISVTSNSDQNIISKFVNQCAIDGLKCGLYYNAGKRINVRRGLSKIDGSYDDTDTFSLTYEAYITHVTKEIEWICKEYTPDYLWLDAPEYVPMFINNNRDNKTWFHEIYNTAKKVSPNTLLITNYDCPVISGQRVLIANGTDNNLPPYTFDGTELSIFPSDIISYEALRIPTDTGAQLPPTIHKGVEYYMPKEIITTIFNDELQYFARNDNFGALKTATKLQTQYETAKGNNTPFLLNVAVAKNGIIPQNQLDRFNEIVL